MLAEWTFYPRGRPCRAAPASDAVSAAGAGDPHGWKLLARPSRRPVESAASPAEQFAGLVRALMYRANPAGDVSPLEYFFTQCLVIPRYLGLVVLPWGFNVDHDVAISAAPSPRPWLAEWRSWPRCWRSVCTPRVAGPSGFWNPLDLCRLERRVEPAAHPRRHGRASDVPRHARHRAGGGEWLRVAVSATGRSPSGSAVRAAGRCSAR